MRPIFLTAAGISFALGVLGVILPGLPATPFLLITSWLLAKSSPRLQTRLLRSRWLGPVLRDWRDQGGVRPQVKVRAMLVVALSVAASWTLAGLTLEQGLALVALACVGVFVIARLPTAYRPAA